MRDNKPLKGKTILVTRERTQAVVLSQSLEDQGARTVACPLIAFSPPSDWTPADRCLERLSAYHGLLFTSVNAVEFTFRRMEEKGLPIEDAQQMTTYAVGPATADALASRDIVVESLPDLFQAEGLASLLDEKGIQGKHFLFPRAKKAREWLLRFLEERGARVDVAVVYETRSALENRGLLRKILATEVLDYLAFTSSSTVRAFVELAGPDAEEAAWYGIPAACIGEITAETARKEGFQHVLAAHPSTIPGLVHAILNHVADNGLLP